MRILIIGCGYVGLPLGQALASLGHEVHGIRRSKFSAAGITAHALDITQHGALNGLANTFDWVINTVSSARGNLREHRAVFLDGTRHLLDWLDESSTSLIFTSSTSVYSQLDGSWVEEHNATAPSGGTGGFLREAEETLLIAPQPATVLRVAGIYGPERGFLSRQFVKDQTTPFDGGNRWLNMIHRDDVIGAIIIALRLEPSIYNVVDDEPVTQRVFLEWLANRLGKPMTPKGTRSPRKHAVTNKRVRNAKLKAAGWALRFPTFREGYEALIREG
tara:strand:+ start:101 stop:925 length:825 start_codon:yes stop_codon:yes gene_type:complete